MCSASSCPVPGKLFFTELPKVGNRLRPYLDSVVHHSMATESLEALECSMRLVPLIFHVSARFALGLVRPSQVSLVVGDGRAMATVVAMTSALPKVSQQRNRYGPKAPNDDLEVELIQAVNLAGRTALNHLRILPKHQCSLVGAPDLASLMHEQAEPGAGVPAVM